MGNRDISFQEVMLNRDMADTAKPTSCSYESNNVTRKVMICRRQLFVEIIKYFELYIFDENISFRAKQT